MDLELPKPKPKIKPLRFPPIDKEWMKFVSQKYWGTNCKIPLEQCLPASAKTKKQKEQALKELQKNLLLRDKLLSIAGIQAVLPLKEELVSRLLEEGRLWDTKGLKRLEMERSRCHDNVEELVRENPKKYRRACGYYLAEDGFWRQHSWGLQKTPKGTRIIETTERGLLYYGIET